MSTPPSSAEASIAIGPFAYPDTASTRAGIEAVSDRLKGGTVAILGCGGTGSYILDLIAKTPVDAIVLIDGDTMQPHNAFRSPGAASFDEVTADISKVTYFASIYSRMHTGITTYATHLTPDNLNLIDGIDFVFLCVDSIEARAFLVPALEERGIPFIDCGLGLSIVDDKLMGLVRVTTSTPMMREHVHSKGRIPTVAGDMAIYRSNVQIADMNALAAALAVMRWKRLRGFYLDLEREYHATYAVDGNHMLNEDHLDGR
ncbi:hypothetical protein BH10PSE14_BH10PSE14_35260 [soil metagenome]